MKKNGTRILSAKDLLLSVFIVLIPTDIQST